MKLPLGLGFALLLMLQNLKLVSTQESQEWNFDKSTASSDGEIMAENSSGLSGDGDNSLLNQTSEYTTPIEETKDEPSNETEYVTSTPKPNVPLNSSKEISFQSNETSTQRYNTTSQVTASPVPTPEMNNKTDLNQTVTLQPETNSTEPSSESVPSNVTVIDTFETKNSTTSDRANSTTASPPQVANSTTTPPSTSPANSTVQNTTTFLPTSESTTAQTTKLNRTGVSFDVRGNSERGVSSDFKEKAKSQAWGVILGISVAVGMVALVVYVIMKRKSHRDFSHRKLVEDMPPEPVLRLENSEPLDLKFDGSGYYNPGIQADNIQMTNFPRGQSN